VPTLRQVRPEPHVCRPDPRLFVYSHVRSSRYFHCEALHASSLLYGSRQAAHVALLFDPDPGKC